MSIFAPPVKPIQELRHDYSAGPDCQIFLDGTYLDEVAFLRFQVRGTQRPVYGYHQRHYSTVLQGQETVYGQIVVHRIADNYLARMQAGEDIRDTGGGPSPQQQLSQFLEPSALLSIPDWVKDHLWQHFNVETTAAVDAAIAELRYLDAQAALSVLDITRRTDLLARLRSFKSAVSRIFTKWEIEGDPQLPRPRLASPVSNVSTTGVRVERTAVSDFSMHPFRMTVFYGVFAEVMESQASPVTVGIVEDCVISGHSQTITTSGEPIGVAYEFMGGAYEEQVY